MSIAFSGDSDEVDICFEEAAAVYRLGEKYRGVGKEVVNILFLDIVKFQTH